MQRTCSRTDSSSAGRECAAIGAVAPASLAVNAADLQRHWLHCTCQPIVSRISCDLALAGSRAAVTAAQPLAVAQLHLRRSAATLLWLGAVWQSQWRSGNRRSCTCVGGSECSGLAAPLAPLHVPAHRESIQLRPCFSWVPYGSHSGAAAIGAVAPASMAVNAADLQRLALAGCRMTVTAAQRHSAQLHLRRWQ